MLRSGVVSCVSRKQSDVLTQVRQKAAALQEPAPHDRQQRVGACTFLRERDLARVLDQTPAFHKAQAHDFADAGLQEPLAGRVVSCTIKNLRRQSDTVVKPEQC